MCLAPDNNSQTPAVSSLRSKERGLFVLSPLFYVFGYVLYLCWRSIDLAKTMY